MSRSKRVFRLVQKGLPETVLCKDMLVVPPTNYVLKGFLIEATSEKDRVYLWKVVTPLHRPLRSVILDYSDRISENGKDTYIRRESLNESADMIRSLISGHVQSLKKIRSPADFLHLIARRVGNSSILFRIDFGLTNYLVGNVDECI